MNRILGIIIDYDGEIPIGSIQYKPLENPDGTKIPIVCRVLREATRAEYLNQEDISGHTVNRNANETRRWVFFEVEILD